MEIPQQRLTAQHKHRPHEAKQEEKDPPRFITSAPVTAVLINKPENLVHLLGLFSAADGSTLVLQWVFGFSNTVCVRDWVNINYIKWEKIWNLESFADFYFMFTDLCAQYLYSRSNQPRMNSSAFFTSNYVFIYFWSQTLQAEVVTGLWSLYWVTVKWQEAS